MLVIEGIHALNPLLTELIDDEYKEMFQDMWPKALQKLKELSEK
ncbi:MAG: hypothetical protein R6W90_13675 [Ignavibacteriaceae bacterium]